MKVLKISVLTVLFVFTLLVNFNMLAQEIASVELGDAVTLTVEVCGVFKSDRSLWVFVPGDPDNVQEFYISEDAKNFDQIKVGDQIDITYYESVAIAIEAPGKLPEENDGMIIMRAAEGETAGGVAMQVYDISAIIRDFNEESGIVTLMGPKGKVFKTNIDERVVDPDIIRVGETVHVRYTKTIAVSLVK